jgi:predicted lipoprotein
MLKRVIVALSLVVLVGVTLPAPARAAFDRRAMLRHLAETIIIPAFREFDAAANQLDSAVKAFAAAPDRATLRAAQSAWVAAFLAWNRCELYAFRRLVPLFNQINKWSTNPKLIEGFIENAPVIDDRFVEGLGSTSRGLPALEYFLFDPVGGPDAVLSALQAPRRMAYLMSLANNLRLKADAALKIWLPEGGNYAEAFINADMEAGDVNGSVAMLTNQIVILLENIILQKVFKPLGTGEIGGTKPELAQAARSGQSLAAIGANVASIRLAFNGGEGIGLDDYADSLGVLIDGQTLSARFNAALDKLVGLLNAPAFGNRLSPLGATVAADPFTFALVNDPAVVTALWAQTRQTLRIFKTEVAANLGVLTLFTDGDGD